MRLDHFVVHIDNNPAELVELKDELESIGIPFNPTKGKGTKGFKVANIWMGDQYIEMPYLKTQDGGGWRTEWTERYNKGERGIFGLCLYTNSLNEVQKGLLERGIAASEKERITFKTLFGLLKKSLPFQKVYTPVIPGTNLQIFFLQMDSQEKYAFTRKYFMTPNSEENGIPGIHAAYVSGNFSDEAWEFLYRVFPNMQDGVLDMGETKLCFANSDTQNLTVALEAKTENMEQKGKSIKIHNVSLHLV